MRLTAYRIPEAAPMDLIPASRTREWMDALPERYANRCLPLRIANEAGWHLVLKHTFEVVWDGLQNQGSLRTEYHEGEKPYPAGTNFGAGILTFHIPYLFRTEPGYNLLARGPANTPKFGASPLEGIVETDWSPYTFTMNWQIEVVLEEVLFCAGEPICQILPIKRGELESFEPEIRELSDDPELEETYRNWTDRRKAFMEATYDASDKETMKRAWQRDYFQGRHPESGRVEEHETKLRLKPFVAESNT